MQKQNLLPHALRSSELEAQGKEQNFPEKQAVSSYFCQQLNKLLGKEKTCFRGNQNITVSDQRNRLNSTQMSILQNTNIENQNPMLIVVNQDLNQQFSQPMHPLQQSEQNQPENSIQQQQISQNLPVDEQAQWSVSVSNSTNEKKISHGPKAILSGITLSHQQQMIMATKVISGLEKNIVSLPFREPINIKALGIDDYLDVIQTPMDLRTIKKNIADDMYAKIEEVYCDIELIISNSLKYNELNPDFIRQTRNFQKSFSKIKRDCQRYMRRLKNAQAKGGPLAHIRHKAMGKSKIKYSTAKQKPTTEVIYQDFRETNSTFPFEELSALAKRIRKMTVNEQIQLFKKINIQNTYTIDLKQLTTKQIKIIFREVDIVERKKAQAIQEEQNKEASQFTAIQRVQTRTR